MRAVLMSKPGSVELRDLPEPVLGPEEVLVEIKLIGLCGSDLNSFRGLSPMVIYPRIPGHEVAGTIVAKGSAVPDSVVLGSRCTVSPYTHCGHCPACRRGRTNTCQFNQTYGVQRDGAMLQRLALHHSKVFCSSILSLEELALVEPLSVGYHAANRGRVCETDDVLVFGCGAIGLGAIAASARKGARVIAVDLDPAKLALARRFGAADTINSKEKDVLESVKALTQGDGVSVAIEAVGHPATYNLAVDAAAFAGRVVCIGYAKDDVSFATKKFVMKELDILGSRNALLVFPSVIQMLEKRERPYLDMVSKTYALEDAVQAFADWDKAPQNFTKILIHNA